MNRLLGRTPSPYDARTLRLAKYLSKDLTFPSSRTWADKIRDWPKMGNDNYGDCVFASAGHLVQMWTGNEGTMNVIPDASIIRAYLDFTGGRDNGANILEVNKLWRSKGICNTKIWAYAAVDLHDHEHVKAAINAFGGIKCGVNLPSGWHSANIWDTGAGRPGSWGGHDVPIIAYDDQYVTCVTWGDLQKISWAGFDYYFDEAWALISPDWIATDAISPSGFDLAELRKDLTSVTEK